MCEEIVEVLVSPNYGHLRTKGRRGTGGEKCKLVHQSHVIIKLLRRGRRTVHASKHATSRGKRATRVYKINKRMDERDSSFCRAHRDERRPTIFKN